MISYTIGEEKQGTENAKIVATFKITSIWMFVQILSSFLALAFFWLSPAME